MLCEFGECMLIHSRGIAQKRCHRQTDRLTDIADNNALTAVWLVLQWKSSISNPQILGQNYMWDLTVCDLYAKICIITLWQYLGHLWNGAIFSPTMTAVDILTNISITYKYPSSNFCPINGNSSSNNYYECSLTLTVSSKTGHLPQNFCHFWSVAACWN